MIPLALALAQSETSYTAKLGTPYLVGPIATVIGTKERLELGLRRWVTIKSARTALVYGAEKVSYVAPAGRMFVIFEASIKNPEKNPVGVSSSNAFGLRLYDSGLKAGDAKYIDSLKADGSILSARLKKDESVDIVSIYEFPSNLKNLRIGTYFDTYIAKETPKYDLSAKVGRSESVFCDTPLSYRDTATVPQGRPFDLGELEFTAAQISPFEGGWAVKLSITNPHRFPARWGWQYAKAFLVDASGKEVGHYPDFFVDEAFKDWGLEVSPGKSIRGDLRFFPSGPFKPIKFRLSTVNSMRNVEVPLEAATP